MEKITEAMRKKKYHTYICLYENTIEGNMKLAIVIEWFCKRHFEPFSDNYIRNLDGELNFNGADNEIHVTRNRMQYDYHRLSMYQNAVQIDTTSIPIKELWEKYGTQEEMPNIVQLMVDKQTFQI